MNLFDYLRVLRRRWWILVLVVVLGAAAGFGYALREQKRYQSSIQLAVSGASTLGGADELTQSLLANQRALLFAQIASKDPVVKAAEAELAKTAPNALVGAHISVSAVGPSAASSDALTTQSPFFTVTVTANNPSAARALATAFPPILPQQFSNINQVPISTVQNLLSILTPASYSSKPVSPRPIIDAGFGGIGGLIVALGLVALLEMLDTSLRDREDVRKVTDTQVLGVIPEEFRDEQLPALTRPHSRRTEAYRQVRTNIELAQGDEPPRVVVVTSPGPGEGKSSTSANLALLASRTGHGAGVRVVLVDADMRKPTIARYFNVSAEVGLSDVLTGRVDLVDAVQGVAGEQLVVLTSGRTPSNPSELLDSPVMEEVLNKLAHAFDLVIVDTPPMLAVTDALVVGALADGVILVARMRATTRQALHKSLEGLDRIKANILGLVVNGSVDPEDRRYGYGYGSYSSAARAPGLGERPPIPDLSDSDQSRSRGGGRHGHRSER